MACVYSHNTLRGDLARWSKPPGNCNCQANSKTDIEPAVSVRPQFDLKSHLARGTVV